MADNKKKQDRNEKLVELNARIENIVAHES